MPGTGARRSVLALTLATALSAGMAGAAADEPSQPYSIAERHLFMDDHLRALPGRATVLSYHFVKAGSFETPFDDRVIEEIGAPDAAADNGRPVKVEFLSGSHKMDLPPIEGAKGNPVIMGFLEHDVREMSRITGGGGSQGAYYKKRLRMAMVATNESHKVAVKWNGKEVAAEEFTLDPYKDDPARSRYARFANKLYSFVLSDQVPGGVYSLKSVMRDGGASGKVMIEESLTLTENK
ncbi:MAG: hypothetical protein KGI67_14655 [Pseudomonadota bacterium]|nr:hypothetical protein [Pseudomonadota bacterium]